ncbi:MAG: hypothetical protein NVS9B12_02350 [Vulcanimicrobiaceae bacterium]
MRHLGLTALRGFAFTIACCFPLAAGASTEGLSVAIPTVAHGPAIDGTLADPVWRSASKVQLPYDKLTRGSSAEQTTVYLLTDGKALYAGFDAKQSRTPVVANQRNNNTGVDTDDEVKLALWPSGKNGVAYQFIATAAGTRYQYSTENLSYEPTWDAAGKIVAGGYVVTMRVPLSIMRGGAQNSWLVNFTRSEVTTGSLYVWSGGEAFHETGDQNYAMPLLGMPRSAASRPQPRIGLYGLGSIASAVAGANTSRMGADLSIPITDTVSVLAALHPDFSNVEQDQQTISPSAFRRFFNETRPFFTQGANNYNFYECDACNAEVSLYTPSIPTPRNGYAIEGKEGPFTFAGFDAVGFGRIDTAQSVIFRTPNQHFYVSGQRVSVNGNNSSTLPGPSFRDDTTQFSAKLDDLRHNFVYANYGTESATSNWITDPGQAQFAEVGAAHYGPNSFFGGGLRRIGSQYNPFDGFFTHSTDAAGNTTAMNGYGAFINHTWNPFGSAFKKIEANIDSDVYHAPAGLTQMDINVQLDLTSRKLWEYVFDAGSSYVMVNGAVTPVTQESTRLIYHSGTATPSSIWYVTGRYGPGRLDYWARSTTIKVGQRGSLSLQADTSRQYLDRPMGGGSPTNVQWLERIGFAYQVDPNTSFAVGVRRYFGVPPVLAIGPAPGFAPVYAGSNCFIPHPGDPAALGYCPNVSFAFHRRTPHDEFYAIYGAASQQITAPQFILKWIHYIGAEKGT